MDKDYALITEGMGGSTNQRRPFVFAYPLTITATKNGQTLTGHVGDLILEGVACCIKSVGGVPENDPQYISHIDYIRWNGVNIKAVLEAENGPLIAALREAAEAHASFIFSGAEAPMPPQENVELDPAELYRAGAGAVAATVLLEIEKGRSLDELKIMCEELKDIASEGRYWKLGE